MFVSLHIDVPDVANETEDAEEDDDIVSGFAFAPHVSQRNEDTTLDERHDDKKEFVCSPHGFSLYLLNHASKDIYIARDAAALCSPQYNGLLCQSFPWEKENPRKI